MTLPGAFPEKPRLFIDVQHGLCNRLRAMASAASIAQIIDYELVVVWRPDHHCDCRLRDLLIYDGLVIEDDTADLFRQRAGLVYNYMEIEPGSKIHEPIQVPGFREGGRDIYVRSAYPLTSPHRRKKREADFLRDLVPAEPVRELMERVPYPAQVAAHVRMSTGKGFNHLSYEAPENWPAERHEELSHWRQKSDARFFMARIDALIKEGQAGSIFLAADLPETYMRFIERYGSRVRFLARDLFDRSGRQLQFALADLLLLTAADRFLASSWSSFSDMAQQLASPSRICEKSGLDF